MTSFYLIAAVALWGVSFVATKICLDYLTPAEIIAARLVLAVPVLLTVSLVKRRSYRFLRTRWKTVAACILVLLIHLLVQVEGMKTTTAGNTAWLLTATQIFIVILSFVFLNEKINLRQAGGMVVAACGTILLISRGDLSSLDFLKSYGDWLVLFSCVTWAVYTIIGKILATESSLAVTSSVIFGSALLLAPPVLIDSGIDVYLELPTRPMVALLFLGVLCLGVAYWFWTQGLKRKSAGQVGSYLYLEPISTMMAAPYFLGERISASLISGGLLIVAGVWMVQKKRMK